MRKSEEIVLKYPVESGGKRVEKLLMRAPKVRDLIASEKAGRTDAEREIYMFAALCDTSEELVMEMDMADYVAMQGVYRSFLS